MKATLVRKTDILRQVRRAFSQRRRDGHGFYTESLRQMAAFAVSRGHTPGAVAEAAGVSRQSILNWYRKKGAVFRKAKPHSVRRTTSLSPVELKIVKSRTPVTPGTEGQPTVRILFRGGACMECPVSAVSAELVAALNGVSL